MSDKEKISLRQRIIDTVYYGRQRQGHEICTICNPLQKSYSVGEKQLSDFIKSIYSGEVIENSRSLIKPYEIDIFLPEINLAIEYNGLRWHSERYVEDDYHMMKSNLCKEKGIHLIHVFEDDWRDKQDIIKSIIRNFISNDNQTKIYARKCDIKTMLMDDVQIFLRENHLLGKSINATISYGLYYQGELVSLMSFKRLRNSDFELSRYAIKNDCLVIGGAERLFSHFIRDNIFSSIITYNDNSVFKGNVYKRLGFQYIRTNKPNYMFTKNGHHRISKQSIRKLKMGYKRDDFFDMNYFRIYDAGKDVYEYSETDYIGSK